MCDGYFFTMKNPLEGAYRHAAFGGNQAGIQVAVEHGKIATGNFKANSMSF